VFRIKTRHWEDFELRSLVTSKFPYMLVISVGLERPCVVQTRPPRVFQCWDPRGDLRSLAYTAYVYGMTKDICYYGSRGMAQRAGCCVSYDCSFCGEGEEPLADMIVNYQKLDGSALHTCGNIQPVLDDTDLRPFLRPLAAPERSPPLQPLSLTLLFLLLPRLFLLPLLFLLILMLVVLLVVVVVVVVVVFIARLYDMEGIFR
jgi:hypothetical protein